MPLEELQRDMQTESSAQILFSGIWGQTILQKSSAPENYTRLTREAAYKYSVQTKYRDE